jgi:hypothetical protein
MKKETTYSKFITEIANKEGKKVETSVSNVREVLKVAIEAAKSNPEYMDWLLKKLGAKTK